MPAFEALLERAAGFLRPMMLRPPPALGSRHPGDLLRPAARGRPRRRARPARPAGALPRADDVGRRPARRLVRDRRDQGRLRVDRRRRRLGRPAHARAPPTTCCTTRSASSTASAAPGATSRGGMGAISEAIAASARAAGADDPHGRRRRVDRRRATGASPASRSRRGEQLHAPLVLSGAHPQAHGARPRRRRALPRRGRRGHAPLPHPRRLGEDQRRAVASRRASSACRRRPGERCCTRASRSARRSTTSSAPGRTPRAASRPSEPVHRGRGADGDRPVADRRRHDGADDVHPVRPARRGRLGRRRARGLRASAASTSSPSTRRTCRDAIDRTTRCSRRRTSSASSASRAARSSRASRTSPRWRSCGPCPELARYATPVDGLYLCGAGTHPGGGVMAASGHNAAQRVLRDLRRERLRHAFTAAAASMPADSRDGDRRLA